MGCPQPSITKAHAKCFDQLKYSQLEAGNKQIGFTHVFRSLAVNSVTFYFCLCGA